MQIKMQQNFIFEIIAVQNSRKVTATVNAKYELGF